MNDISKSNLAAVKQEISRLCQTNKLDTAEDLCQQLCLSVQDDAESWFLLGAINGALGNFEKAAECCRRSIAICPEVPTTHYNLGIALMNLGKPAESEVCFRAAIGLKPDYADAYIDLGNVLWLRHEHEAVEECLKQALGYDPSNVKAYRCLATACSKQGRAEEARNHYEQVNRLEQSDSSLIRAKTVLPALNSSNEEIDAIRKQLHENISGLLSQPMAVRDPVTEIGASNFYLAYHGRNDRDLQVEFAKLYLHACPSLTYTATHCQSPKSHNGKIRVGFISHYLMHHSIGKTSRGLIEKLDRERFTVVAVFLQQPTDQTARIIANAADEYIVLPLQLDPAREQLTKQRFDILFYQDIGMDEFTYFLAFSRLAPVQCTTFGHPVTTGIPNMDFFVSTNYYEPDNGQDHYSEKLYRLTDVASCAYYYRPKLPGRLMTRSDFGLAETDHIYICPQALFKLHPEFDDIMAKILRADPLGKIILIKGTYQVWERRLRERFRNHMPDVENRILFIPQQKDGIFTNLLAVSEVMLDPIHFGGQNTTHEGLSAGTPIVTWPGEFHRGRHTYGFYRKLGFLDCVANSHEEYVTIAVQLGTDPAYRQHIVEKIKKTRHKVWEEESVVRQFEDFFINAIESKRQ